MASRKKADLLLTLLGEKEEELEAAIADQREIKNMYKDQIEALLMQIAPPLPSDSGATEAPSGTVTGPDVGRRGPSPSNLKE